MDSVLEKQPVRPVVTEAGERIHGFDVARLLALLGMIVVHFALVMASDRTGPTWLAQAIGFLDGRAAATFVVLAGIGLTLRSRRLQVAPDAHNAYRVRKAIRSRGLFLLVVGFVNLLIWPGDILRVYGVSLLLAAWFIFAPSRRLLLLAGGFALGFVLLLLVLDYEANWEWATLTYRRLWTPTGMVRNLFYDGFRSVFPWTGFLFLGMWLGRLDLRNASLNTKVALGAVGVLLLAEISSWLCVSYFLAHPHGMDAETIKALLGTESMPPLPLFLLAGGGAAVAVIAVSVRLTEACPAALLKPLVATGQMALTWYCAHIVLGLGAVALLGLTTSQPLRVAVGCGLLFFVLAVLLSWPWKRQFRHGPLEWVLRTIAG
jgi:uncharacterized protein